MEQGTQPIMSRSIVSYLVIELYPIRKACTSEQATASKVYRQEILISQVFDSAEAREGKKPK